MESPLAEHDYDVIVALPAALDSTHDAVRQYIVRTSDAPVHRTWARWSAPGARWVCEGECFRWYAHDAKGRTVDGETLLLEILSTSRGPILAGDFDRTTQRVLRGWWIRALVVAAHVACIALIVWLLWADLRLRRARFFALIGVLGLAALQPLRKTTRILSPRERAEQRVMMLSALRQLGEVTGRDGSADR